MINYILLLVAICAGVAVNILTREINNTGTNDNIVHKVNLYTLLLTFIMLLIINGGFSKISMLSLLVAFGYAFLTMVSQISFMLAVNCGSVSLSSFILSCGFVLSVILGAGVYKEPISMVKALSMVALVISLIMCMRPDKNAKFSVKWIICAATAFASRGLIGFLQKFHQTSQYRGELNEMLIVAFAITVIFAFVLNFMYKSEIKVGKTKAFYILAIILAILFVVQNVNNTSLSGKLPAVIFFPVLNGGVIVGTSITAGIMYKETFSNMQKAGLIIGIISMCIVGSI